MKTLFLIICIVFVVHGLAGLEADMLNLTVPSQLEKTQLMVRIAHRFYGEIDEEPLETFFGLDQGANVSLGLRYAVLPRVELKTSYTRLQREYTVGASYAYHMPRYLRTQLGVQFFDFQPAADAERLQNLFYSLSVQTEPIADFIMPVVNVGYDGYNEKFGVGVGVRVGVALNIRLLERVSFLGEYYPVIDREEGVHGDKNCFVAGIGLETYGHHFMFMVGNNFQMNARHLMLGAETNDLYFGANIQRVIDL